MESKSSDTVINPIGVYGWRKRCLYFLVLLLILVIIMNIGLTVWILVVLKFNIDGMGGVRITNDGLQVQDTAEFLNTVYVDSIAADKQLHIQSHENISLETNTGSSKIELNSESVTVQSDSFKVELNSESNNPDNAILLTASTEGGVRFIIPLLYLNGSLVDKRITTKEIIGMDEGGIIVEGVTLNMAAEESITLNSESGPIDIIAAGNLTLSSNEGKISISCDSIILENLPSAVPFDSNSQDPTELVETVYNLCMCSSGRLYRVLATAENDNGCLIASTKENPCSN